MFPRVILSSEALRHNLAAVRGFAPRSRVLAVIKGDGYGHGIVPVARALTAADAFAVARLCEAIELRAAGVAHPIVLLEGVFSAEELDRAAALNLDLTVHSFEQLRMLEARRGAHRFPVWCKVNTGMSRLGFAGEDFKAAWERLVRCKSVAPGPRLMTHFAVADEPAHSLSAAQMSRFFGLAAGLGAELSLANSAALIGLPAAHADWVRPGIMLYGISPCADRTAADLGLQPVMTLDSQLIAVRTIRAGETVGYGARWAAPGPARIGIVAAGYADGYPRHARDGTPVLVGGEGAGRRVPVAGRVSMDMISVDLTQTPQVQAGERVVLWGEGLPIEEVAAAADTIGYELVCKVTRRVERVWT